ncbi:MAG TPA: hypothetical protein VEI83_04045 [Acidimicrobiales bacterium]|nr:hypothetical protein [Acidimicrobiales bacterium]
MEQPVGAIPWDQVGPGWILATWDEGPATPVGEPHTPSPTTLYLVNPIGGRYAIRTFAADTPVGLDDWSGDGRRALLTAYGTGGGPTTVIEVDLTNGQTIHSQRVTTTPETKFQYTRPYGRAVLATIQPPQLVGPLTFERTDTSGAVQLVYATQSRAVGSFQGGVLSTPDGTELILGAQTGLIEMSNDGHLVGTSTLPTSSGVPCSPHRWWTIGVVLASCGGPLYLVPLSGGTPTQLTAPLTGRGPDLGDLDAWKLDSGTFVQAASGCGDVYLAKLNPDGTTTPVMVPDVDNSGTVLVVGAHDELLAIQAKLACGGGVALVWYNPTINTTNLILGPPLNGGGVANAILFRDPNT